MRRLRFIAFVLGIILFPISTFAHRQWTLNFSQPAGAYFADMDWDVGIDYSKQQIQAGRSGKFAFDLFTYAVNYEQVDYDAIRVNIRDANRTIFSGPADKPPELPTESFSGLSFVFPNGGRYAIDATFSKNGEKIVTSTFPLDVLYGPQATQTKYGRDLWIGLAGGIFLSTIVFVLMRVIRIRSKT